MSISTRLTVVENEIAEIKALVRALAQAKAPTTEPTKAKGKAAAKAPEGLPFAELRTILRAHKAAGLIEPGVSVKQMLDTGRMDAFGNLGEQARQAVEVEAEAPAKARRTVVVTENHASQGPRDAKGRITAKTEWALRERLAETGQFDRHEIDAIVAAQV